MYKCQLCNRVVPAKTQAHRIVIQTRYRRYPARREVNRVIKDGKVHYTDDPGGEGYETVREIVVCPDCAIRASQYSDALSRSSD